MDALVAETGADLPQATVERTPLLDLDGFSGPLEQLLGLARAREIDLARLSLPHLVDQLMAAMQQAVPLGQKADWVVMAAWLVQLRSQLFLPVEALAQQAAETTAGQLRERQVKLQEVQALAAWLETRSQLGRDVFARGQPEILGTCLADEAEVDVIEFLWAAMALFDDDLPQAETAARYQPRWLDLYSIPEARLRILRLLAEAPDERPLDQLLPERPHGCRFVISHLDVCLLVPRRQPAGPTGTVAPKSFADVPWRLAEPSAIEVL